MAGIGHWYTLTRRMTAPLSLRPICWRHPAGGGSSAPEYLRIIAGDREDAACPGAASPSPAAQTVISERIPGFNPLVVSGRHGAEVFSRTDGGRVTMVAGTAFAYMIGGYPGVHELPV